jgi:hypothetical protein
MFFEYGISYLLVAKKTQQNTQEPRGHTYSGENARCSLEKKVMMRREHHRTERIKYTRSSRLHGASWNTCTVVQHHCCYTAARMRKEVTRPDQQGERTGVDVWCAAAPQRMPPPTATRDKRSGTVDQGPESSSTAMA